MTRFLKYLSDEIPCNILVHCVKDVSRWYRALTELGITHTSEVDCKDLFDKIPPHTVVDHMQQASQWLTKCRHWRAKELILLVYKEHKQLDRAGQGAPGKFWHMQHQELQEVLNMEMSENIHLQACGSVWAHTHCIPMGGSFSAQSADLHSSWALYEGRKLLRSLGDLHFTSRGFPYWVNDKGGVSLCQFRDNSLVAYSYPDSAHERLIHRVCNILGRAWNLRILCECQSTHTHC